MASETQGLASVAHDLRRACKSCGRAMLHQPSPPGDSSAGTARCASRGCRQVFGLVATAGTSSPPPRSLLPRATAPVHVANASPLTAAGQCRDGRHIRGCVPHRLPFSSCSLWLPEPTATTYWADGDSSIDSEGSASSISQALSRAAKPVAAIPRVHPALRKTTAGHTNKKRAEARFSIRAKTLRLIRPRGLRLRPRPSSTGGCGPACRLPAP